MYVSLSWRDVGRAGDVMVWGRGKTSPTLLLDDKSSGPRNQETTINPRDRQTWPWQIKLLILQVNYLPIFRVPIWSISNSRHKSFFCKVRAIHTISYFIRFSNIDKDGLIDGRIIFITNNFHRKYFGVGYMNVKRNLVEKKLFFRKRTIRTPSQRLQFILENVTSNLCEMGIFNSILLHYWKLENIAF